MSRLRWIKDQAANGIGRLRRQVTAVDLKHAFGMRPLGGGFWEVTDEAPHFRSWLPLRKGLYRLELVLHLDHRAIEPVHSETRLYLETPTGDDRDGAMTLPCRSGKLASRVIYLPATGRIRLDPLMAGRRFRLERFVMRRLSRRDADAAMSGAEWGAYNASFERAPGQPIEYARWIVEREPACIEEALRKSAVPAGNQSLCSFVIDLSDRKWSEAVPELETCLETLRRQPRDDWQLAVIATNAMRTGVRQQAPVLADSPFVHWLDINDSPGDVLDSAFLMSLEVGDQPAPEALDALSAAWQTHPNAQVIYTDHDRLDESSFRHSPAFKPDWSPLRQAGSDYIGRSVFLRRDCWPGTGEIQRAVTDFNSSDVVHIPAILFHEGSRTSRRGPLAAISGEALEGAQDPQPSVSLIMLTRDGLPHLRKAVESIVETVDPAKTELLIVDNDTREADSRAYLDHLAQEGLAGGHLTLKIIPWEAPFNFAAMNNWGARHASGEVLGFLNDDIEAVKPGWLQTLGTLAMNDSVGCVGPWLLYPNGRIQHAGIALGLGGLAGHPMRGLYPTDLMLEFEGPAEVSAVTGAALFLRRGLYAALGGMQEALTVAYNDVDLCLRAAEAGFANVAVSTVTLIHHESATRGSDEHGAASRRLATETHWMQDHWGNRLHIEPYYNEHLTRAREDLTLR